MQIHLNPSISGKKHSSLHHVFQFPHISRPVISKHFHLRLFIDPAHWLVLFRTEFGNKKFCEVQNIFFPATKRRHLQLHYVQPIIQILSESSLFHFLTQVLIGRRDQSKIHFYGAVSADTHEFMFLQDTQEFHLRHQRKLSYFVQKDRSAFRKFKVSFFSLRGSGKTSFLIAEQFALDQTLRDSSAVHLDKRLFVAALFIDLSGKNFFARPGFPDDQHRNIRFGNLFDLLQDKADLGVHTGTESRVFHRDRTFGFFLFVLDRSCFAGHRFIIEHGKERITHFLAEFFDHADLFFRQRLIDIIAFDV